MIRIAVLDDYQNVSLEMADWSPLAGRAEIAVFNDHLSNFDDIIERLLPFDVICVMRERTPLPRSLIERLPRLKLIASTGPRNAAIDVEAAADRGIVVPHTGYDARSTIEMTWALILASARQVAWENAHLRAGGWQLTMGHPFRSLDNVLATPCFGFVARELYRTFYGDTVENIVR
jgi:phosphoglycerate dehydrogenase-like enzyme